MLTFVISPFLLKVFAPENEAFANISAKYFDDEWTTHLTNILEYHVVLDNLPSTALTPGTTYETLNGEPIIIGDAEPGLEVNEADVIEADLVASNGVVHGIDEVLLPSFTSTTVVDIALSSPDFSTLVNLLGQAGLVETLSGDGPFTVFAPTNAAFDQLGEEVINDLTDPSNVDALTDILLYHVVGSNVFGSDLTAGATVTALNDASLTVTSTEPLTINGDSVVDPGDILASNGVVHVISAVLLPPTTVVDVIEDDGRFVQLVNALTAADLVSALEGEGPFTVRWRLITL